MKRDDFIIYAPDLSQKTGFINIWKEMLSDLLDSRELIWRFFVRDFTSHYRQAALGVLWAFIMPVVAVGIFIFLNKSGILNVGATEVPYPVFALFGITIWTLFSTGLSSMTGSIVGAGGMIQKINFPRISLVISSLGNAVVDFLIRLVLLAIVFLIFKVIPSWKALFLPLGLFPLFLLTLGLGFFFALFSAVLRDVSRLVALAFTFLMFICPVVYPLPRTGILANLNAWNPLTHFLNASRDIVFKGTITNPQGFFLSSLLAIFLFFSGWIIFHIGQTKIAERI